MRDDLIFDRLFATLMHAMRSPCEACGGTNKCRVCEIFAEERNLNNPYSIAIMRIEMRLLAEGFPVRLSDDYHKDFCSHGDNGCPYCEDGDVEPDPFSGYFLAALYGGGIDLMWQEREKGNHHAADILLEKLRGHQDALRAKTLANMEANGMNEAEEKVLKRIKEAADALQNSGDPRPPSVRLVGGALTQEELDELVGKE